MKYKINKINDDGSLDVTFSVDNKKQNISGLSIDNIVDLDRELTMYTIAYEAGLTIEAEANVVDDNVSKLVGVDREVGTPLDSQVDISEDN